MTVDETSTLRMKERDLRKHQFTGLVEHSHHLLRCSACGRDLIDVMVTEPNIQETFRFRADCPHCGDHSFPSEPITGGVYLGPAEGLDWHATSVVGDTVYVSLVKRTK